MNKLYKNKLLKNKKIIFIMAAIVGVAIAIIFGGTAAYFGWSAEEEATISVKVVSGTGSCSLKDDNNVLIEPVDSKMAGRIIKLTAFQQMATSASITWNMVVNEIGGLQDETFNYEYINTTTGVSYGGGNFADIEAGDTITFSNSGETLEYNTEYEFVLYLWIDGTIGSNLLTMADQTFDFDMNCIISSGSEDSSS